MPSSINWSIEQGLTSHQTHYRSFRGRFLQVMWPNQQCQSTEGSQLVFQLRLESHQDHSKRLLCLVSPCLTVLCQSFNFMTLIGFLCTLHQVIDSSMNPSYFLSFKFPFQQQQSIWTTKTAQKFMSSVYRTSFCLTILFVKCSLSCFIFLKTFSFLICLFSADFRQAPVVLLYNCSNTPVRLLSILHYCWGSSFRMHISTLTTLNSPTTFLLLKL